MLGRLELKGIDRKVPFSERHPVSIMQYSVQTKNITYQLCNILVQTKNITYQICNIKVQTREGVHYIDNKSKDYNIILYFNMQVENFHRDAHCVENEKILGAHLQVIFLT